MKISIIHKVGHEPVRWGENIHSYHMQVVAARTYNLISPTDNSKILRRALKYCPMCKLQMSWWVFHYQATSDHIVDSFSVTQDNENYYYWLEHHLKGKYRAIYGTLWFKKKQCTGLSKPTINTKLNRHLLNDIVNIAIYNTYMYTCQQ